MVDMLECSCGYSVMAEAKNDPNGILLGILKGIHEMTFPEHKIVRRAVTSADLLLAEQVKAAKSKRR